MISQVLGTIRGIEIFPIISLILFFSFFIGMLIIVLRMNKNHIDRMKRLPLEDGPAENDTGYQDEIRR